MLLLVGAADLLPRQPVDVHAHCCRRHLVMSRLILCDWAAASAMTTDGWTGVLIIIANHYYHFPPSSLSIGTTNGAGASGDHSDHRRRRRWYCHLAAAGS